MKILNAFPGISEPMNEEEVKSFMANNENNLFIRLGIIDEKGEPNVIPLAYYFDNTTNKIYINTLKTTKKVRSLNKNSNIARRFGATLFTASETTAAAWKSGIFGKTLKTNTITSRFVKAPSFSRIAGIPVEVPSRRRVKFDKFLKGSRLIGKIRSIRFVLEDVAVIVAVGGTVMEWQPDIEPDRNSINTIVALKRHGKWRFTAFQNTRAHFMWRPEESRALTEELRHELISLEAGDELISKKVTWQE